MQRLWHLNMNRLYICFDFSPIFSIILNGFGWFLCNIGSVVILFLFKCKLPTIKEPKRSSKKPRKLGIRNFWFTIIPVTLVTLSIILENNEVPLPFIFIFCSISQLCISAFLSIILARMKIWNCFSILIFTNPLRYYHGNFPPILIQILSNFCMSNQMRRV